MCAQWLLLMTKFAYFLVMNNKIGWRSASKPAKQNS